MNARLQQAKSNLIRFMFRILYLPFHEWKTCQLETKIQEKNIPYTFDVRGLRYLNHISPDLQEQTEKMEKCWRNLTLELKV